MNQIILDKLVEGNYLVVIDDAHKILKDKQTRSFARELAHKVKHLIMLGA